MADKQIIELNEVINYFPKNYLSCAGKIIELLRQALRDPSAAIEGGLVDKLVRGLNELKKELETWRATFS